MEQFGAFINLVFGTRALWGTREDHRGTRKIFFIWAYANTDMFRVASLYYSFNQIMQEKSLFTQSVSGLEFDLTSSKQIAPL